MRQSDVADRERFIRGGQAVGRHAIGRGEQPLISQGSRALGLNIELDRVAFDGDLIRRPLNNGRGDQALAAAIRAGQRRKFQRPALEHPGIVGCLVLRTKSPKTIDCGAAFAVERR